MKTRIISSLIVALLVLSICVPVSADTQSTSVRRNAFGETYGKLLDPQNIPDLIAAVATNGKSGYIKRSDFEEDVAENPEEAVQMMKNSSSRKIPVYESDGVTVIGEFIIGDSSKAVSETLESRSSKSCESDELEYVVGERTYVGSTELTLQTSGTKSVTGTAKIKITKGTSVAAGRLGVKPYIYNDKGEIVKIGTAYYNGSDHCTGCITSTSYATSKGTYKTMGIAYVWKTMEYDTRYVYPTPYLSF